MVLCSKVYLILIFLRGEMKGFIFMSNESSEKTVVVTALK